MKENALTSEALALAAAHLALAKKAEDVVLLDLRQLSPIADFFVICSASGEVHAKAVSDGVQDGLLEGEAKLKPWHVEGYDSLRWVLLDYVGVVCHVFQRETRRYYSLERLWGDAPRREVLDVPPARPPASAP